MLGTNSCFDERTAQDDVYSNNLCLNRLLDIETKASYGSEPMLVTMLCSSHRRITSTSSTRAPSEIELDGVVLSASSKGDSVANSPSLVSVRSLETDDSTTSFELGSPELPTVGSVGHTAGLCQPCTFFWRSAGCTNGVNCSFCHLCEKGEKARRTKEKKEKLRALNTAAGFTATIHANVNPPEDFPRQAVVAQDAASSEGIACKINSGSLSREAVVTQDSASSDGIVCKTHSEFLPRGQGSQTTKCDMSDAMLPPGLLDGSDSNICWLKEFDGKICISSSLPERTSSELGSTELPTVGSASHLAGFCQPCTFFWRSGCTKGVECSFCHLCEKGEKRRRTKEKKARFHAERKIQNKAEKVADMRGPAHC